MERNEKMKSYEQQVKDLFTKCDDFVGKSFYLSENGTIKLFVAYIDGLTDSDLIQESVIRALFQNILWQGKEGNIVNLVAMQGIETPDMKEVDKLEEAILEILAGNTGVWIEGYEKSFVISSKKLPTRGVEESNTETVIRGPKDSFNESLRTNTALIRRRIRDTGLKIQQRKIGKRSHTDVALVYMEEFVQPQLLEEIEERLTHFEIDGIFDSGMLEQMLEQRSFSPFPQIQATQRPDKAASSVLEGRVAIVVDNSPEVLLAPTTLNCFYQASDDYYNRVEVATFARILRYFASFLAVALPGLYLSVAMYHTELLPTSLALSFASARSGVPFPIVVEVLLMELAFELLREAGLRLPGRLGGTIGIVGGLIVGQAAVEANLVSTIVVIVVALTAIAAFSVPNEGFAAAYRILKFFFIIMSAWLGLYGLMLGILLMLIHLSSLKSFGIPYLMPAVSGEIADYNDKKDFVFRYPIFAMKKRPIFTVKSQQTRLKRREK